MTFTLKIECDNEAFEDYSAEVARLLHKAARQIDNGETDNPIFDMNGNKVGEYGFNTLISKARKGSV